MKVGVVLLCRYDSKRLPGKILKLINGKPILLYIIERLKQAELVDDIVVATSDQDSDDPISSYCQANDINCFRGSLQNVAQRFIKASQAFYFDYSIRINGDNLFTDAQLIDTMIKITLEGKFDFTTNVPGRTFPTGMSVEILSTSFYQKIYDQLTDAYHLEHVTIYLYQNDTLGYRYNHINANCPRAKGIHLAIDSKEDFERAEGIISKMEYPHTKYGLSELYNIYIN